MDFKKIVITCFCSIIGLFGLGGDRLSAQINADFEADVTSGCDVVTVNFTDLSSSMNGIIVSWIWDLDGAMATASNPSRIYNTPGQYTICLTVTDLTGASDTECKTNYIVVHDLPMPNFTADATSGCGPLTVNFTDLTIPGDGAITQWIWELGGTSGIVVDDGTLPVIQTTYTISDVYTVNLTVIDEFGCSNNFSIPNLVEVFEDPVVDVTADQNFSCTAPLVVNFTNNSPTNNVTFQWDFGNGDPVFNGPNPPAVNYTTNGLFDVTIIAINTITGCVTTQILDGFVSIGQGVTFDSDPDTACIGEQILFTDLTQTPASTITWEFGDGMMTTGVSTTSYQYMNTGCYNVTLTRDANGCVTTSTREVCVVDLPIANFVMDNPLGCAFPHIVNFTDNSTNATSWFWEFGQNGILGNSLEQSPSIQINSQGLYPITLTVTGSGGCQDTFRDIVQTFGFDSDIVLNEVLGCPPINVCFPVQVDMTVPVVSYEWIISDTILLSGANPCYSFTDTGSYDVMLIVENALGCIDTSFVEGLVQVGTPPVPDFTASPTATCAHQEIQFANLSNPPGQVWVWDFGDGSISTDQNPLHTYRDTGCFDVELNVFNNGCNASWKPDDYICIFPPVAIFDVVRDCDDPFNVDFINNSIGRDSVFWDFGVTNSTSDTTSLISPSFMYPDTGVYTVSLIVYNEQSMCYDTAFLDLGIYDLSSSMTLNPTSGCVPLTIQASSDAVQATSWTWSATGGLIADRFVSSTEITFALPGTYDVTLIVSDDAGCSDTLTQSVTANRLQADYIAIPDRGCIPLNVNLTQNAMSPFGTVVQTEWVIGDSLYLLNGDNVNVTIDSPGIYSVTLMVLDDLGCGDTITDIIGIQAIGPLPEFTADTAGCVNEMYQFINASVGNSLTYSWDFGDNTGSMDTDPVHVYTASGLYTVCLTVTDGNACDTTLCKMNYVEVGDPMAGFTFDSTFSLCPPLPINFTNISVGASQYIWDFGDGSGVSAIESPTHVYTVPGVYDVDLVAIANAECSDTATFQGLVVLQGPVVQFETIDTTVCAPANILFKVEGLDIYDYQWDLGDGTVVNGGLNSTRDSILHEYRFPGKYNPVLRVVDTGGCEVAYSFPSTICVAEMSMDFSADDRTLCDNVSTMFDYNVTSSEPLDTVYWIFEGGLPNQTADPNPTVTYASGGLYDVTLIADNGFCRDTLFMDDYIGVGEKPVANYSMSQDTGCLPFFVDFADLSTIGSGNINQWLWDFGDNSTDATQNPGHEFLSGQDSLPVSLIVTSGFGCMDTIIDYVYLLEQPMFDLSGVATVCLGDSLQLTANFPGGTNSIMFNWLSSPDLSCTNCLTTTAVPSQATTYYFEATGANGCTKLDSVQVRIDPNSILSHTITRDTFVCFGESIQLNVTGGILQASNNWDVNDAGLSCYACDDPIASPITATTYHVTINSGTCSLSDSVHVSVIDERTSFLSPDVTICEGDTTTLEILSGSSPNWINPTDLSCNNCFMPEASPTNTTEYRAEVSTMSGCLIRDTVLVTVIPFSSVTAGPDANLCLGQSVQLQGQGVGNIAWTPNGSLMNSNTLTPLASPLATTTYVMTVTNGSCVFQDSVLITVASKANISGFNYELCYGDSIQVEVIGIADDFVWTPSDFLSDPFSQNPLAYPPSNQVYEVTGSLAGCPSDTTLVGIEVLQPFTLHLDSSVAFIPGDVIQLNASVTPNGSFQYLWSPSSMLSCITCLNPTLSPTDDMMLTLTVFDPITGCEQSRDVFFKAITACRDLVISVPNVFSPNGDGVNDELKVISSLVQEIQRFRIFDRWGSMMFETGDIHEGWDGTFNGEMMNPGVYVFFVEAICPLYGSPLMIKGDITLIR